MEIAGEVLVQSFRDLGEKEGEHPGEREKGEVFEDCMVPRRKILFKCKLLVKRCYLFSVIVIFLCVIVFEWSDFCWGCRMS